VKKSLSVIIILVAFFIPKIHLATLVTSNGAGGGVWGAPATWLPSIPACGDTILIQSGDIVTIESLQDYSACPTPSVLYIDGTLEFPVNGPKLKFPDGSSIVINTGGLITSTSGTGGGSSNFISIGSSTVWKKADGDANGPLVFGTPPLPIKLISFEANINEDKVDIKWITAAELNNDYFTLERSVDGKVWEEILITAGAGNSNNVLEYFETDYKPLRGISYYRLKQTDFNGEFSYSNIVPVKYIKKNNGKINLFPSPLTAGTDLHIEFKDIIASELLVVLRDIKGREYYSKIVVNIEGGKLIGIPVDSSVPNGIYIVTASSENQLYSQKLIIKNQNLAIE
jgi:hypothetical protein